MYNFLCFELTDQGMSQQFKGNLDNTDRHL